MHKDGTSHTGKGVALKVLIFAAALMLGIATYLYSVRSTPVLYRHILKGNPVKEPDFTIFNPFRDRSPERSAEAFLELMKASQCEQAMSVLPDTPEYRQEICEREKESPLMSWQLTNRNDEPQKVRMYYWVKRQTYSGYQGQLWITVEKGGEQWQVTRYESWY